MNCCDVICLLFEGVCEKYVGGVESEHFLFLFLFFFESGNSANL